MLGFRGSMAVVVAVAGALLGPPAVAADEDPGLQRMAAEAYVDAYGVGLDEAYRRVELQDRVMPSVRKIEAELGGRYAGAWFDETDGGRLKLGVTEARSQVTREGLARVTELLKSTGARADVDIVARQWSLDELEAAQAEIDEEVARLARGSGATTAVDVKANAVVVTRSQAAAAGELNALADARAASSVPVRERVVQGEIKPETRACTLPYCDRPMRGGVRMTTPGRCTAGFNAVSRTDGKAYVLTAGHCLTFGTTWSSKIVPWGVDYAIGQTHNKAYPFGIDAGIVRANNPNYYWSTPNPPRPWVVVDALSGVTTYNESYHIAAEGGALVGGVLCVTGGGGSSAFWGGTPYESWTWCGTVTANPVTVWYYGYDQVSNLIQTNLCFHGGMSGGPAYKNGYSYGLVSGDWCTGGHQQGYLYPTWLAEDYMNVNIVH